MQSIPKQTRLESYEKTLPRMSEQDAAVYRVLAANGPLGAWQIARLMNREVYQIRPNLTRMSQDGLIRAVGKRYEEYTDRNEAVWDLAGDGQLRLL